MKLIVDNGSTKADWCFINTKKDDITISTDGINPIVQPTEEIESILRSQLVQQAEKEKLCLKDISETFFYGAGCSLDMRDEMVAIIKKCVCQQAHIEVESDMLGAARALCGREKGIACILGTGANSCVYDGEKIIAHTPALGYILGDEGSGAVLGRNFINAVLKGTLPYSLRETFLKESKLSVTDILHNVYKSKAPNRFLASMSKFIYLHLDNKDLEKLVVDNFKEFIKKNILPYGMPCATLNAVGSIAFYYKPQFEEAAKECGYRIGRIIKSPIVALANFHKE